MWKKILAAVFMVLATAIAMAAVDVNKASQAELDSVKGIGPVTSKEIMAERKKSEFKDWQDFIKRVKGVGEKKAEQFSKEGVTVNGETYKNASSKSSTKDEKKSAKAEKKEAKADAKAEKKQAKAEAKAEKKEAKAEASKSAASSKK